MTSYQLLKEAGHHPAKAAEIVLDAKRGDKWASDWIACLAAQKKRRAMLKDTS